MMKNCFTLLAMCMCIFLVTGCGEDTPPKAETTQVKKPGKKSIVKDDSEEDGSWWCRPHGIAEEECSMCSAKVAKAFKAKGDWCDLHDRAKSQCFICDPELMEKAKLVYKAKTGEEMPLPKKNMPVKK
jgi:hypothetical protein